MVHGGAGIISNPKTTVLMNGVRNAAKNGYSVLKGNGTCVKAVEEAIKYLESNEHFNAGYGSPLNKHGRVEMSATVIDGATMKIGNLFGLNSVRHPISAATKLLREQTNILAGEGAIDFSENCGCEIVLAEELMSQKSMSNYIRWGRKQREVCITIN